MGFSFKQEVVEVKVFAPIAPGVYDVKFDSLEEKQTQSGGVSWNAKMKIINSGRTFFLSWNVENASEVSQRIAREQLTQIATLLGVQSDINLESIKTNKAFTITLEQRVYGDKTYYQTKGPWKLAPMTMDQAVSAVEKSFSAPVKKKSPWEK
jgi:hypothetical protein